MSQNISDFYRVATAKDFARKFQFRVHTLANTQFNENALVYVESAALPGRTINNVQVPFMGLQFNVPGTASYPNSAAWNVTFRSDANYDIRGVLEQVTLNTFDESTSTGNYNTPGPDSVITLELLDKQNNGIRVYNLVGAYVQNIGEMAYNIGDTGTIQTVTATLAYQYWQLRPVSLAGNTTPGLPGGVVV
jgi:hypothetical protein